MANRFPSLPRIWSVLPKKELGFWITISTLTALISGLLADLTAGQVRFVDLVRHLQLSGLLSRTACIGAAIIIFFIVAHVFVDRKTGDFFLPLNDRLVFLPMLKAFVLVMGLGLVISIAGQTSGYSGIVVNPGGLFAILTGVATIIGVYFTLVSVLDFRQNITSFPDLIERLCVLIEHTADDDTISFLAFTPAIGSLSLPDRLWTKLVTTITSHRTKVDMVCLASQDLAEFNQLFLNRRTDRGTITQSMVNDVNVESERVITFLGDKVKRVAQNKLPGYYLFANRNRAIIVAPFFMPIPEERRDAATITSLPTVQMFGLETSDSGIVSQVHQMYDIYKTQQADEA